MTMIRMLGEVALVGLLASPVFADDITEAMDQARKAYQSGDLTNAKQSLDLASQLIGQKNAEGFVALLPAPLSGWTGEKAEASAIGASSFGASSTIPSLIVYFPPPTFSGRFVCGFRRR